MSHSIVNITGVKPTPDYIVTEYDDIEDFEFYEDVKSWHLVNPLDGERVFCDGLAYEDETTFRSKEVKRGGITCKGCLRKLEIIKSVKL